MFLQMYQCIRRLELLFKLIKRDFIALIFYTINQSTSNETGFLCKKNFREGIPTINKKFKITQFALHIRLFLKHIHLCLDDHTMCSFGVVYLSQFTCCLFLSNKTFVLFKFRHLTKNPVNLSSANP